MTVCAVCGKSAAELPDNIPLVRCANPACRNHICARHGLMYEVNDAQESRLDYYCSRQCWQAVQRRSLPVAQELAIAALFLLLVIPLYLYVVSLFT